MLDYLPVNSLISRQQHGFLVRHSAPVESCCVCAARYINVSKKRRDIQTDRRTDGRQTVTLRLPLDAASVIGYQQQC